MPSRSIPVAERAASSSTSISGWSCLNRPMRRTSHVAAKDAPALITMSSRPRASRMRRAPDASLAKPSLRSRKPAWPASVSDSPRPERRTSGVPISASSARTCWATAALVTCNSSAALAKLRCWATTSKALRAFKDGSRCGVAKSEPRVTSGGGWRAGVVASRRTS